MVLETCFKNEKPLSSIHLSHQTYSESFHFILEVGDQQPTKDDLQVCWFSRDNILLHTHASIKIFLKTRANVHMIHIRHIYKISL